MFDTHQCEPRGSTGHINRPRPSWVSQLIFLTFTLILSACASPSSSPSSPFPDGDSANGWTPSGESRVYDSENLFDLVNGQAEAIFAYGFEQVTVQDYEDSEGGVISIEVWQTETAPDAYGLFTSFRSGSPTQIGGEGDIDPGRRLAFWQSQYYVRVRTRQEVADADLWALAEAVAAALPSGGERPSLVDRLPVDGILESSVIFFHEEISVQSRLWLGGTNVLGLGRETDGVLATYVLGEARALLILVEYPDTGGASDGLAALQGGEIAELVSASASDSFLAAVFGEIEEAAANSLAAEALNP
jgi:hypothetical protein